MEISELLKIPKKEYLEESLWNEKDEDQVPLKG